MQERISKLIVSHQVLHIRRDSSFWCPLIKLDHRTRYWAAIIRVQILLLLNKYTTERCLCFQMLTVMLSTRLTWSPCMANAAFHYPSFPLLMR